MPTRESHRIQTRPIEKTIDVREVINYLQGDAQRAMNCFKLYRDEAVRIACLKIFRDEGVLTNLVVLYVDWFEKTTRDLAAVDDYKMARRLLEVYATAIGERAKLYSMGLSPITCSEHLRENFPETLDAFVRLMRFLAEVGLRNSILAAAVSKNICIHLVDFSDCYIGESMEPVRRFFRHTVGRLQCRYSESDWHSANRVLRFILGVGDLAYVERLDELIAAHERGETGPDVADKLSEEDVVIMTAANIGALQSIRSMLSGEKKL